MIYTEYTKASSFTMLPFGMINEVEMLVNSEAGLVVIAKKKKKKLVTRFYHCEQQN